MVPVALAASFNEQFLNCHSFGSIYLYFQAIAGVVWKVPVALLPVFMAVGNLASGKGF